MLRVAQTFGRSGGLRCRSVCLAGLGYLRGHKGIQSNNVRNESNASMFLSLRLRLCSVASTWKNTLHTIHRVLGTKCHPISDIDTCSQMFESSTPCLRLPAWERAKEAHLALCRMYCSSLFAHLGPQEDLICCYMHCGSS